MIAILFKRAHSGCRCPFCDAASHMGELFTLNSFYDGGVVGSKVIDIMTRRGPEMLGEPGEGTEDSSNVLGG